jgi:cytoskeletal protein CcmA (bactofilin family)
VSTGTAGVARAQGQDKPQTESLIDRDSHFNGLYETKQNLRIEGLAEGELQCEGTLTVAEGARVKAKVTASTITIAGQLKGEVVCRGVFQIMPSGEVDATVSARRLIVQEGGLYNGEFHMITEEASPATASRNRNSSSSQPAADRPNGETGANVVAEDVVGSDEWWAKIAGKEPPTDDEPPK